MNGLFRAHPRQPSIVEEAGWCSSSGAGYVILAAVLVSWGVSFIVVAGQLADLPLLTRWLPYANGAVPEAVIGTLIASIGIWLAQHTNGTQIRVAAGLLKLLGIVNLLVLAPSLVPRSLAFLGSPGIRLAPGAALAFMLLGIGLTVLSSTPVSLAGLWAVGILGVATSSIGSVTLLAYASGLVAASWWGAFSLQMAVPTAVTTFALGTALVAHFFRHSKQGSRHLSIAAAVLALLGLLLLFAGVDAAVLASSDAILTTRAENRKNSLEMRAIQGLMESARNAEAAQAGYLLTGNERYSVTFQAARQGLARIVQDDSVHDRSLIQAVMRKSDELDRGMGLARNGKHDGAIRLLKSFDGPLSMDRIEAKGKHRIADLQKTNSFRQSESQKSILSERRTILLSYSLAVLLAAGAVLLVRAEMRCRTRIEEHLRAKETKMLSELRDQTLRAEEATQAKSGFLASMSHEIRTLMNAILGMADMLWDSELTDTQRHYVEVFRRAGGSLLMLINDILDFSKIESGAFTLESANVELHELVEHVVEMLKAKAESKHLLLSTHIDKGTPIHVVGDAARLHQVLLNLLSNAVKFTPAGEVSLRVRSASTLTHTDLEFEVSDTGIGIASENLSFIFEDFTQAESSTTRRFGGSGLGLSISRRLAQLMGGDLRVHSELGRGSTFLFNVTLPIGLEERAPTPLKLEDIAGKRVLIVDNNTTNRVILSEMCSRAGMIVTTCRTGEEAVVSLKTSLTHEPFAIALVDRLMPGMDGFETVIQMRIIDPRLGLVIVSSDAQSGDLSRCREMGLCGHLIKPVRRQELLSEILKALGTVPEGRIESENPTLPEHTVDSQPLFRILVAEDSEDNRFLLQAYCEGTMYRLTFVENGKDAVATFATERFDLMLMDVQMPVMDGLTAAREIRNIEVKRQSKRVPILALTANAQAADVKSAHEAGCDAHLGKPISKHDLVDMMQRWLTTPSASQSTTTPLASFVLRQD